MTATKLAIPPRLRFATIVAAIDFDNWKPALEYAAIIGRRYGSALHIAHVVPPETYIMPPEGLVLIHTPTYRTYQEAETSAQKQLERAVTEVNLDGLSWEAIIQRGSLRDTLEEIFQTREADLLILGTHARHGFDRLISGSAAETLLHEAPCPVLLLGPNVNAVPTEFKVRSVIFAADLCTGQSKGLNLAVMLAEEHGAKLTVAHIVEQGAFLYEKAMIEAQVENAVRRTIAAQYARVQPDVVAEVGHLPETLTAMARERHADLVVVDAHPPAILSGIATHFVTGAILKIAAVSEVPLLCVPVGSTIGESEEQ
jgi:nucleotide-binding universal stress UspA family protein